MAMTFKGTLNTSAPAPQPPQHVFSLRDQVPTKNPDPSNIPMDGNSDLDTKIHAYPESPVEQGIFCDQRPSQLYFCAIEACLRNWALTTERWSRRVNRRVALRVRFEFSNGLRILADDLKPVVLGITGTMSNKGTYTNRPAFSINGQSYTACEPAPASLSLNQLDAVGWRAQAVCRPRVHSGW